MNSNSITCKQIDCYSDKDILIRIVLQNKSNKFEGKCFKSTVLKEPRLKITVN